MLSRPLLREKYLRINKHSHLYRRLTCSRWTGLIPSLFLMVWDRQTAQEDYNHPSHTVFHWESAIKYSCGSQMYWMIFHPNLQLLFSVPIFKLDIILVQQFLNRYIFHKLETKLKLVFRNTLFVPLRIHSFHSTILVVIRYTFQEVLPSRILVFYVTGLFINEFHIVLI